jgi:hypothetical protein
MMREIKFRAWDKACGGMVVAPWKLYLNGGVSIDGTWATADVVLMQYTGLTDRNGKEIYEGDIVKNESGLPISEVRYSVDLARFMLFRGFNGWSLSGVESVQVIGNIYENPDLLETSE